MQNCFQYMCLAALVAFFSSEGYAQRKLVGLSGIVYDSATRAPMPYVSVVNRATNAGTMSADNGTFTIGCAAGDTIVFTMVGYSPQRRIVDPNALSIIVLLSESSETLKSVTVYGSYKPQGSDQWKTVVEAPRVFSNPAAPGSGYNVQTFGPGITMRGLLSGGAKSEKEKRKVMEIRDKAKKSEVYNEMIKSEETKAFFRKTFSMSEEEYNTFVLRFNATHPEAAYLNNKEEIKNLMVVFKATSR
jgi:hypothetical protein